MSEVTVHAAQRVLARLAVRKRPLPSVVLVDGRSGAGKTTLAYDLAAQLGAQLVHMDELYPGWDGLAAGAATVAQLLRTGSYERYDWGAGVFTELVHLDRARPVVIEGCGAVTAENRAAAELWQPQRTESHRTLTLWLECPAEVRFERAMVRDGDMFRPHWQRWSGQEVRHFSAARPIALATEILQSR